MRFQAKVGNEIIGFSELEGGDPPMGVAGGRLLPTSAYASMPPYCIKHRDDWVPIPELTLEVAEEMCDQISIILGGRILARGTVEDLRALAGGEDEKLTPVFLKLTGRRLVD